MAIRTFNSVGGFSVGIPPVTVIDETGKLVGNISADSISASGNIIAQYFTGNFSGGVTGNITVTGADYGVAVKDPDGTIIAVDEGAVVVVCCGSIGRVETALFSFRVSCRLDFLLWTQIARH